jgi:hypothetical protein
MDDTFPFLAVAGERKSNPGIVAGGCDAWVLVDELMFKHIEHFTVNKNSRC